MKQKAKKKKVNLSLVLVVLVCLLILVGLLISRKLENRLASLTTWKSERLGVSSINLYKSIKKMGVGVYGIDEGGAKKLLYLSGKLVEYNVKDKFLKMSDGGETQMVAFGDIDEVMLLTSIADAKPIQVSTNFDDKQIKLNSVVTFAPRFNGQKSVLRVDTRYTKK